MYLKSSNWHSLYKNGYTIVSGGVDVKLIDEARYQANILFKDENKWENGGSDKWKCIKNCSDPCFLKIFEEFLGKLTCELYGYSTDMPNDIQLAAVLPGHDPQGGQLGHIDGGSDVNDPKGFEPFSALIGVALQDVVAINKGNLKVWPGSHWDYQAHFRNSPLWETNWISEKKKVNLAQHVGSIGRPVYLKKGDIFLSHMFLFHGVDKYGHNSNCQEQNCTCPVRYMAYHRSSANRLRPDIYKKLNGEYVKIFDESMMHNMWAHFAAPLSSRQEY